MCTASPAAPVGAGMSLAGMGINAIGQNQGLQAKQDAWDNQMAAQRGYDAALQGRTQQLIAGVTPQTLMAPEVAAATQAKLDTTSNNTANAVLQASQRRTGGASASPDAQAQTGQEMHSALSRALQDNQVQSALQALTAGRNNIDILGRQYGLDSSNIRNDAQQWAGLAPMQQQAAGMHGQFTRDIGNLFNMGGQGLMSFGMSQPGNNGNVTSRTNRMRA